MSLFVGCFCSNAGNALGESSNAYDELSSANWKSREEDDPKVESGSNVGNGTSSPIGGVPIGESTAAYDELSSLSWKKQWGRDSKVESGGRSWFLRVDLQLTVRLDGYLMLAVTIWKMKDLL